MVARVQPHGALAVSFTRVGREIDLRVAPDGVRALKMALLMLASLDELRDGDALRCVEESL
jgi:hypothetical protein